MKDHIRLIQILFSTFDRFVSSISDSDMHSILKGDSKVRILLESKTPMNEKVSKVVAKDYKSGIEEMQSLQTREEVSEYLKSRYETKHDLLAIAQLLDLPASKKELNEKLINRIVEGVIGYKIRSAAIRRQE